MSGRRRRGAWRGRGTVLRRIWPGADRPLLAPCRRKRPFGKRPIADIPNRLVDIDVRSEGWAARHCVEHIVEASRARLLPPERARPAETFAVLLPETDQR